VSQIRDERRLAAPPEVVWQGLATADGLLGWFWPPSLDPRIEVDLRVGGRYRIASPVAGMAVSGEYTTVRPAERLEFGWHWDGEDVTSSVTVTLKPDLDGATLVVEHDRLADSEVENHMKGWSDCLDRLPDWLAARTEA
jgi:uncharacterized protein YndB with AHSA1/START domain